MYRMSNGGIFLSPSLPEISQPSTPQRNPGGVYSGHNRATGHGNYQHGHPRPLHHMDSGIDLGGVSEKRTYRLLTPEEWARFCRGVGVFRDDESQEIVRPTSSLWPATGFRDGLYQVCRVPPKSTNYTSVPARINTASDYSKKVPIEPCQFISPCFCL